MTHNEMARLLHNCQVEINGGSRSDWDDLEEDEIEQLEDYARALELAGVVFPS